MALQQLLKRVLQSTAGHFGYRIVPANRDAYRLWDTVYGASLKTVVDVGANHGHTCRNWLMRLPQVHVHAIEPTPEMLVSLRHLQTQYPNRVTVWDFAASDRNGEAEFLVHVDHPSSSSLLPPTSTSRALLPFTAQNDTIRVQTRRLDDALMDRSPQIYGPTLLKLDVQGSELEVLRGAEKLLTETTFVVCEVNLLQLYEGQPSFEDLLTHFRNRNFKLAGFLEQFSLPDGRAVYVDALFIR